MALQIQVKHNEKVYALLPDGEKIEITYIHRENGNKVLAFTFPPIVRVYRETVYKRILQEGGI